MNILTAGSGNKRYHRMSIQFSIVFAMLLLLFIFAQSYLIISNARKSTRQDYSSFCAKITAEDSEKIKYWNKVLVNDLRIYSDSDIAKTGTASQIISWIQSHESIRNPLFNYIMYCTPDGVGHLSSGKTITVISKPFYRAIMKDKKDVYVSNIDFQTDGSVCYYIARTAYDAAGNLTGVFAGAVKLDEISKMLGELTLESGGYALLAGSDGVLLAKVKGAGEVS